MGIHLPLEICALVGARWTCLAAHLIGEVGELFVIGDGGWLVEVAVADPPSPQHE